MALLGNDLSRIDRTADKNKSVMKLVEDLNIDEDLFFDDIERYNVQDDITKV